MKRVLLHSCCGPCSTSVLESLRRDYDTTVFFYNPNVYPCEEYRRRLDAERSFCMNIGVEIIEGETNHVGWLDAVKGNEDVPEGGARCEICFEYRLRETASLAAQKGFDYFATTLTVSPHKNYGLISKLGNKLAEEFGVAFLDRDFKKHDGFRKSIEISKEHSLYRQRYCGCEFSLR